ncbi:MAG TPA: hypothetical protein VEL75_22805, partial [Candidatus Methylomirabilis sp.]|nr:hypothetical protein [Candidatus Methylomirabilis sp.]
MRVIRLALAAALALAGPAHGAGCSGAAGNDVCETARSGPAPAAVAASAAGKARAQSKRAPGSRKVHPAIDEMVSAIEARQSAGPRSAGRPAAPEGGGDLSGVFVRVDASGAIQVHVLLTEFTEANVAGLEALGLRVELTLPRRRLVQGWLPAGAVGAVAALDCVRAVKPPGYPVRSGAGVVTTAGDSILGAAAARSAFGVTGAGVKVGVISDGVDHLASSVQTGDLPPDVAVVKAGSGDEGTAMLEIVHDLAPGAPLAFYGPSTDAEMVVAIETLAAVGSR